MVDFFAQQESTTMNPVLNQISGKKNLNNRRRFPSQHEIKFEQISIDFVGQDGQYSVLPIFSNVTLQDAPPGQCNVPS